MTLGGVPTPLGVLEWGNPTLSSAGTCQWANPDQAGILPTVPEPGIVLQGNPGASGVVGGDGWGGSPTSGVPRESEVSVKTATTFRCRTFNTNNKIHVGGTVPRPTPDKDFGGVPGTENE